VFYGTRTSTVARSMPQTADEDCRIRLESVCGPAATGSRLCIAKDVPLLRADHAAGTDVLSGVREVACTSDKMIESVSSQTLK